MAAVSAHVVTLPWRHAWRGPTQSWSDRRTLRGLDGVRFAVCGATSGGGGTRDIGRTLAWRRQLVLVEWESAVAASAGRAHLEAGWRTRGAEIWSASLAPSRSRGTWNGVEAFAPQQNVETDVESGVEADVDERDLVAVLTFAKVKFSRLIHFYLLGFSKPARDATGSDSTMIAGIGFGDIPVRHACTLTFWPSSTDVVRFAYGEGTTHGAVQQRSNAEGWLAESLFARFSVVDHRGSWSGSDPLHREQRPH